MPVSDAAVKSGRSEILTAILLRNGGAAVCRPERAICTETGGGLNPLRVLRPTMQAEDKNSECLFDETCYAALHAARLD